jgi:cell division protease FtsH
VTELLQHHRSNLDELVAALLEHETLDETDAYEAAGLGRNRLARDEAAAATVTHAVDRSPS